MLTSAFALVFSAAIAQSVPPEASDLGAGVHIHLEREVEASAEASWTVLAHQFGDVAVWSSKTEASRDMSPEEVPAHLTVDSNAPVPGRVVQSAKFGEIGETLVAYDEEARSLRFAGSGLPKLLPYAGNTQSVVALGEGRSKVVFDIYFVPKGPLKLLKGKIKKKFAAGLGQTLDELADYIETGTPVASAE